MGLSSMASLLSLDEGVEDLLIECCGAGDCVEAMVRLVSIDDFEMSVKVDRVVIRLPKE
jgi:hypothetical protein